MKYSKRLNTLEKPKQIRLSTYVDNETAKIVEENAQAQNKSISEYLGDILAMYLGRLMP